MTSDRPARRTTTRRALLSLAGLAAAGCIVTAVLFLSIPSPMADALNWPVSPALLDKNGDLFHARLSVDEEFCLPVPLAAMGKWLPLVAIEIEDRRFRRHVGIDPLALARAVSQNLRSGGVVSGASTITSQVVRLTYPKPRTLWGKVTEFVQAVKLERSLTKDQILELYLNRAPFGGPVRGVEAAARSYFNKKASELSLAESALLIGMLRGPSVYRPDRHPKKTLERRNRILAQLRERQAAPLGDLDAALLEKLPPGRGHIPQKHRHFADFALRSLPAGYWNQGSVPVKTTLDPYLQNLLEVRLAEALWPFTDNVTAAGAVSDNATGALLAYVGNARFSLAGRTNWVDCGNSPRSPGSTLKPFIYLLGMEQGWLLPASLIADTPLSFAGMAPRNYDRSYRGPVSAEFALANSLNAPAVRVQRRAGGEATLQFLRSLGFSHLDRTAAHYGDSLGLGGCEVTLLQTTQAFSTLAAMGISRPLTALVDQARPGRLGESRLFSEAGAFLIAESLRDDGRMPPTLRESFRLQGRKVAFKTGTSYGLRDAWTAAYTPEHTVAVWLGDPEGMPHPALTGLPVAAPVALRLLRDMPADRSKGWYPPPIGIERYQACTFSGAPASPFCPLTKAAWRIASVSRTSPCAIHTMNEGKVRTVLPPELEAYAGQERTTVAARPAIDITMPQPGMRFFTTPHSAVQHIPLTCEGARGKVYWFLNNTFFGVQEKGATLLLPLTPGRHVVSLVDESGNTAAVNFRVVDVLARQPKEIQFEP